MEFQFTPAEEKFRQEIKDFLENELPAQWLDGAPMLEDDESKDQFAQAIAKKMGTRGWITAAWPKEYGGLGWNQIQQLIFAEEMMLHKVPRTYILGAGTSNVGPTLAIHGTEEQKRKYLPGIAQAEDRWCQLFSEPNAGSDLAGVETKGVDEGDYFSVTGVKIWSSMAHKARWGACLCRTDPKAPKHKGITYLIVDMKSPGIVFKPLVNICDVYAFNQVFLDNVKVPKENVVSQINRGWYVGATTLNMERSFVRHSVMAREYTGELMDLIKAGLHGIDVLKRNPVLRHKLAEMYVEIEASKLLAYRVAWLQSKGGVPSYESSVSKLFTSEMTQRLVQVAMELLGLFGQLKEHSKYAVLRGKAQQLYLAQRAITIGGGTSEIQRTLIARRGLGMPGAG